MLALNAGMEGLLHAPSSLLRLSGTAGSCALGKTSYPEEYEHLRSYPGTGVENDVPHGAGARGDEALVPFVEAGYESGAEGGDVGPAEGPLRVVERGQGGAPGAE